MRNLILLIILSIGFISACTNSDSYNFPENPLITETPLTPEELREQLAEQERLDALSYLSVSAKMREDRIQTRAEGLFREAEYESDGNTIFGTIQNSATLAKFKDVVVTVTFYSQTETIIETKQYIIYQFFAPNSSNEFELKVYPPEAMAKFDVEVMSATAL